MKAGGFDFEEYKRAITFFKESQNRLALSGNRTLTVEDIPDPENACGWAVVDGVHSAIKHLHKEQQGEGTNPWSWELVQSPKIEMLLNLVKGRQKRIQLRKCTEKDDKTLEAFVNCERFPEVEHEFWKVGHWKSTSKCNISV